MVQQKLCVRVRCEVGWPLRPAWEGLGVSKETWRLLTQGFEGFETGGPGRLRGGSWETQGVPVEAPWELSLRVSQGFEGFETWGDAWEAG